MPRKAAFATSCTLVAFSVLIIAVTLFNGCGKSKNDPDGKTASENGKTSKKKTVKPLLKDWEKPDVAFIVSGLQNGYLEPCGCTADSQIGGLAHRADLFKKLTDDRKWNVVGLDAGGLLYPFRENRKQDELKLQQILKGLSQIGYVGVGLGLNEMKFARDTDYLLTLPQLMKDDAEIKMPFISANVNVSELGPRASKLVTVGDRKIGITAAFAKKMSGQILPAGKKTSRLEITEPEKSLPPVLAALKKAKPDLLVLLLHAARDEAKQLAEKFPEIDLIVFTHGPQEGELEPTTVGKTMLVSVGEKGKHVGVVGFYPNNQKQKLRYELVELDAERFGEDERMHKLMQEYQTSLKDNKEEVFADVRFGPHPGGNTYVGVASCKDCHKKAYAIWSKTKHAKAYEGLLTGRPDQKDHWVKRHYDPECLSCHVTGWKGKTVQRYESGFLIEELAKTAGKPQLFTQLHGNQCENCHGPGSRHVELENAWLKDPKDDQRELVRQIRESMKLNKTDKKVLDRCVNCHDLDNSPKFKFDKYWKEVEHKGKD